MAVIFEVSPRQGAAARYFDHLAGQFAGEIYAQLAQAGHLRRGAGRTVDVTARGQVELLPRLIQDFAGTAPEGGGPASGSEDR